MKYSAVVSLKFIRTICICLWAMYGNKISSTLYMGLISELIIMSEGGHIY